MKPTIAETFDQQWIEDEYGCWVWRRACKGKEAKAGGGYGCLNIKGKTVGAHVFAYERSVGQKVPKGFHVMHLCHNTKCVRPLHLVLGTNEQNAAMKAAAFRAPSKLTPQQVRGIRAAASQGELQRSIAERYGLHQADISNVVNRKYWKQLD